MASAELVKLFFVLFTAVRHRVFACAELTGGGRVFGFNFLSFSVENVCDVSAVVPAIFRPASASASASASFSTSALASPHSLLGFQEPFMYAEPLAACAPPYSGVSVHRHSSSSSHCPSLGLSFGPRAGAPRRHRPWPNGASLRASAVAHKVCERP